jgi:16S rRNA (cytosine1402-N4)-methyltransferase
MIHKSVLLEEILQNFAPKPGDNFIDATAGEGGHAIELARQVASMGKVLAVDRDPEQIQILKQNLQSQNIGNVIAVRGNFRNLRQIVQSQNFISPKGILFDLGFSLRHILSSGRGFSFNKNELLDMRYNPQNAQTPTAKEFVNSASCEQLEKILKEYGEEEKAKQIAREIIKARKKSPIETTGDLVNIITQAIPGRSKIHPATKTFQALRIAVNNELENITKALPDALEIISSGGKIAVISFHSLEDALVKNLFKKWAEENMGENLTKKVIKPAWQEIQRNPQARSAKLRIFRRAEDNNRK